MSSTEIRLTFVFRPGYDGEPFTVNVEEVLETAEEITRNELALQLDFVGYRVDQVESFEAVTFSPFTGISPGEEAMDDHASHPEPDTQSTTQELQTQ
jgi:hypothetical protein